MTGLSTAHYIALFSFLLACVLARFWVRARGALMAERRRFAALQKEKQAVFDFIHDVGEAFTEEMDQRRILDTVLGSLLSVTTARGGAIYLRNNGLLTAECVRGLFPPSTPVPPDQEHRIALSPALLAETLQSAPLSPDAPGIITQVWKNGEPANLDGREARAAFPPVHEEGLRPHAVLVFPLIYRGETLGVIAVANPQESAVFNQEDLAVGQSIAAMAAFSLHHAGVYRQLAEKRQIDHDLAIAQEIQHILLPDRCPQIPGYDLAAVNQPARVVSGDYYDFIHIDEDRWGMVIADVSGKGIPASLVMSICRTVLRTRAPGCTSAAELLRRVNRALCPDLRDDMFITLAYIVLDTKSHTATLAKAGHDAPFLFTRADGQIREIQSPGMVLGIDSGEVFDMVIQDVVIPLEPGDFLLLTTDGVHEALGEDGQEYGRPAVRDLFQSKALDGAQAVTETLLDRLRGFRGNTLQSDDITILSIRRR